VGITQIRDALNADPDRYPPPIAVDPARSLGAWSRSSIWEVLRNPKYTGYQVWNRRARKTARNRENPPETWIWSEEPAHPALVSKEEFDAVAARAASNHRSRQGGRGDGGAVSPPKREYLYRGLVRCGVCGLRMWGNHRRRSSYYSCQPSHQRSANIPADHPPSVYLGEPVLHEAVVGFMSAALLGPDRQGYWRRRLADSGRGEETAPAQARLEELRAVITDLERRIERQVANLEAEDATPSLRRRVGARIAELEEALEERRKHANALAAQVSEAPATVADLATALDRLPLLAERLQDLPQPGTPGAVRQPAIADRLPATDARSTLRSRSSRTSSQTATAKRRRSGPCPREGTSPRHGGRLLALSPVVLVGRDVAPSSANVRHPGRECRRGGIPIRA